MARLPRPDLPGVPQHIVQRENGRKRGQVNFPPVAHAAGARVGFACVPVDGGDGAE